MCGIVGVVDAVRPVEPDLVSRMCRAIRHRGPDDEGMYLTPATSAVHAALGARRLSIIDVAGGHQPVGNEDGTVWVVQNGEIYNFVELRAELEGRGHRFKTRSDTEVIVHAYEEFGDDCIGRLDGMFALAVWDERRQRLLLARDRLGKKPLVYAARPGRLTFGSEISAVLLDPAPSRDLDPDALDLYLTYLAIPAPLTIHRGIRKLPPGHTLTFERGEVVLRPYWTLPYEPKLACSESEAAERLVDLLRTAVRRRLVSEVPLGSFLSGGVDSSVVTALMATLTDRPVKTFSIGFEEPRYNELPAARRVADRFGCEHHEFVVKPRAADILPTLVEHFGEPYADSSALPTFYLSQLTRQHVTVALSGDGGDELFAGYGRHVAARMVERWQGMPRVVRAPVAAIARAPIWPTRDRRSRLSRARRVLEASALSPQERYERWVGHLGRGTRDELYAPGWDPRDHDVLAAKLAAAESLDAVDALLAVDTGFYLPTDLLVKTDIMSMANSLEVRSPFLDHHLVEFAARLPSTLKLRRLTGKYLVKRAFAGVVPAGNLHGTKRGFAVPIGDWFRGDLRDFLSDHLLSARSRQRGLFEARVVERLVADHVAGRADWTHPLWTLLMLELWHRAFPDRGR